MRSSSATPWLIWVEGEYVTKASVARRGDRSSRASSRGLRPGPRGGRSRTPPGGFVRVWAAAEDQLAWARVRRPGVPHSHGRLSKEMLEERSPSRSVVIS
jgi:hypothetical protein